MNKQLIIFFPFAGASFYSYRAFEESTPHGIDILALEAPGRGKRISEDLISDIHLLVDDFYQQIVAHTHNYEKYYFFGHSLGAVLAFLVMKSLVNRGNKLPAKLVLSGKNPPHINAEIANRHLLSNSDFKQMIKNMGGTPKEVLENIELLEFFLPILRADFSLIDTAKFNIPIEKINTNTTILYGNSDKNTNIDILNEWDLYFTDKPNYVNFQGDHFFIYQHINTIFDIILSH